MNKPIILQGAMQCEIDLLVQKIELIQKKQIGQFVFYEGTYKNYPIVISKTKIGEITSAIATTLAIQEYDPLFILNQGTAGALVEWLNKKDIVIGSQVYYLSSFSCDPDKEKDSLNPWKKTGYHTLDHEYISFQANEKLLKWIQGLDIVQQKNIYFDCIGSGDIWTKKIEQMNQNAKEYKVVCEEMECAGAYMAANSLNVPLISIRVISNNEITKQAFEEEIATISQQLVLQILDCFIKGND